MAKTRGAHSFRPRVRQALLLLPQAPLLLPLAPLLPTSMSSTPPQLTAPLPPKQAPALVCLLCAPLLPLLPLPLLLVILRVPPLWPLHRGGIILELGPHHQLLHIPGQPKGPHLPRGPGLQAQRNHLRRDLGRRPPHLIRVLTEPQTYLRGPSSGDLTSPTTPFRGMLAAGIEIFMGKCIMISRPFPWTRDSKTLCSSYNDTIWNHSWCRISSIILGSSPSSIIR